MKKLFAFVVTLLALGGILAQAADDAAYANALSIKDVETAPVPLVQEPPVISADIKGIEAMVHIAFVIDENGSVVNPTVLKSSDDRMNAVALDTVAKWSFKAAINQGKTVAVRAVVPIRFK